MNYLFNFCWLVTCLYQHADAAVTPAQRLDSVPSKDNNGINSPRHSNLGIEQHLLKARQAAPTGVSASVALSLRHSDELYVTTVTLGKDKVNLVVDTGSSDL